MLLNHLFNWKAGLITQILPASQGCQPVEVCLSTPRTDCVGAGPYGVPGSGRAGWDTP